MEKKGCVVLGIMLLIVILSAGFSAAKSLSRDDISIRRILINDYGYIYPQDKELFAVVSVENLGSRNANDLVVSLFIPELDIYTRSASFDLDNAYDKNDRHTNVFIFADLPPFAMPGEYYARVTVHNDDISKTSYVPVMVLR